MSGLDDFQQCADGHHCDHGSVCVEEEGEQGVYTCNCDAIEENAVYAGLKCEHKASRYCNDQNVISKTSFCTNGGKCKKNVSPSAEHLGCDCTGDYMGNHCEFTKGIELPEHIRQEFEGSSSSSSGGGGGLSGGAVAAIVLIVVAAVLAVGLFVIRKRLRQWDPTAEREEREKDSARAAPDLMLEADGGVLIDSVKSGAGVNSSAFSSSDASFPDALEASAENGHEAPPAVDATAGTTSVSAMENGAAPAPVTSPVVENGAAPPPMTSPVVENGASAPPVTSPVVENGAAVPTEEAPPTETVSPPVPPAETVAPPAAPTQDENVAAPSATEEEEVEEESDPTKFEIV